MNRLRAANNVPFANADTAPTTGTPQYATDGNPNVSPPVPQTIWPAYAWNMVQDELMAVVLAAGLTPDDTNWAQLLAALRALFSVQIHQTVPSTSGTYTPSANLIFSDIEIVGGGGGGGGGNISVGTGGSGGGAGGFARGLFSAAAIGASQSVIIGAGGAGGVASGNGSNGGTTSVGTLLSATGGTFGTFGSVTASVSVQAGSGGVGSGGSDNAYGGDGGLGTIASQNCGGCGGASRYGGGGQGASYANTPRAGYAPGSGGGGGYSTQGGASGAPGRVTITEYIQVA